MPFRDSEFDALWSVWVLEHIPNPEAALREIRRVIKPNGLIFLMPAWRSREWAAEGYEARPYSDFGIGGKLVKASLIVRSNRLFLWSMLVPTRMIRLTTARLQGGPTRLHYRRLEPNYEVYWQPDSDAVNSLDAVEVMTWFESRGDECLNCSAARLFHRQQPLVIRVRKSA